ncbi:MAG: FkbM family methyltransferase [Promethearchaeota archaeon]
MLIIDYFQNLFKNFIQINLKLRNFILNQYFRSIFYRKKHIKKGKYDWLKKVDLSIVNKNEGILRYKNLQYKIPKKDYKTIPLHQKYLYAALVKYYNIPKHFLLFWDSLLVFNEIFLIKEYNKEFQIRNGDIILDIGASIGWYTCKVSKLVGDNGKIIAIEPNQRNYEYLKKNIEINNLNNIITINKGVWSSKKELIFLCKGYGSTLEFNRVFENKSRNFITINVDTIDNIISELKLTKINLIKMDIEGAEIEAILGAKYVINNFKMLKLIIAAYHKNQKGLESFKILVPYLERRGFKIFEEHLPYIIAIKQNNNDY